ncbi:hypothetical protein C1N53_13260 [Pontibacter sp. SGAir0037]|nr:hypothetical protein C1N53_13260 [Pontibacter sp. SGAir0037]
MDEKGFPSADLLHRDGALEHSVRLLKNNEIFAWGRMRACMSGKGLALPRPVCGVWWHKKRVTLCGGNPS